VIDTNSSGDLLSRTIYLVKTAPRHISYAAMAKAINVDRAWITRFHQGQFENPGIKQVQALHDYLVSLQGE
jgi:hypothetical protein